MAVAVDDTDVEGIRIEPGSLRALTGSIRIEGGETSPLVASHISLLSPRNSAVTSIDAEGNFRLNELPPEIYRVKLALNGSFYARSVRQGGRDALRDGVVIAGAEPDPLEIVLSSHGATIEGTVPLPDSDEGTGVLIGLLRRDGDEMVLAKQAYAGRGHIPGIGRFTMQGVPPGDYVLFAWPQDAQIEYANPEAMRQYDALGKPVSVTEDARVSVNIDSVVGSG
jgi:hypothetical protein